MAIDDRIILDLVKRLAASTPGKRPPQLESLGRLSDITFEDYLMKAGQGLALYSSPNYFLYVSKSMAKIMGHPISLIYESGPGIFQKLITSSDKPLVQEMALKCQHALQQQHAHLSIWCQRISCCLNSYSQHLFLEFIRQLSQRISLLIREYSTN